MKSALRNQLRAARRSLSSADHKLHSKSAARAIMRLPMFAAGKRIALYLPFDRETDTAELITQARRRGVHVYVPVISDRRHCRLRFYPLAGQTVPGEYGILVPSLHGRPVSPQWLNLIVVPLVGVDGRGRRLGMGGGYYDRALGFRRRRRTWMGPRLVGLAFDSQRTTRAFAQAWDVKLNSLATESGIRHFLEGPS
jgi:5-formyltetrahydrofolate cyclo-ligase